MAACDVESKADESADGLGTRNLAIDDDYTIQDNPKYTRACE